MFSPSTSPSPPPTSSPPPSPSMPFYDYDDDAFDDGYELSNRKWLKILIVSGIVILITWIWLFKLWTDARSQVIARDWVIRRLESASSQRTVNMIVDKTCFDQFQNSSQLHLMIERLK